MTLPATTSLSVIVPVYNEALCLQELCGRLYAVLNGMGRSFEVLFVDDGSSDDSLKVLTDMARKYGSMRIITFTRNFGQHQAVTAGMAESRGEVVVTLDADLQNPPEEIPKLVEALEKGYDLAAGWRTQREDSLFRTLPSKLVNRLISRVTRVRLHDYGCMLRAYNRSMVDRYLKCGERSSYITALMSLLSRNVVEVPVRHDARTLGESKYHFFSLFKFVLNIMIGFSDLPIRLVNWTGLLFFTIGAGSGLLLLASRLCCGTGYSVLPVLLSALFLLFGVQFLLLGLLGGYLARTYSEVQKRPRYVIDRVIGG